MAGLLFRLLHPKRLVFYLNMVFAVGLLLYATAVLGLPLHPELDFLYFPTKPITDATYENVGVWVVELLCAVLFANGVMHDWYRVEHPFVKKVPTSE